MCSGVPPAARATTDTCADLPDGTRKGILSGTFSSTGVSTLNSQLNTPDANNNPVGALTSGQVSESQVINGTTYTVKLNANWPIEQRW